MIYNGFDTPVPVKKGDETEKRKQEEKDLENEERFSDLELKRFMEAPSKEKQCHEAFSNQQKISGRKSLDWMLLSNRFVRTAEGGVNTGGGMDMTKYLSGSYYRLYTLQSQQRLLRFGHTKLWFS